MSRRSKRQPAVGRELPGPSGSAAGRAAKPIVPAVPSHNRWLSFAMGVALALAVWAVFGQTRRFDFVNYDDDVYVNENPVVERGLTLEGIGWAFTHNLLSNWHPLTVLSYMADAQCYGLKPGGYHLTNVLLHTLAVVLLFLVLKEMTGALWRSAFVAAVFAIHPLRVESVAWVSERKDVLSGLFFMLTLLCYVKAVTRDKGQVTGTSIAPASFSSRVTCHLSPFYWLALLFFALGLMSKPMLVTLPFVLLLLDYWPLRRIAECGVRSAESTLNAEGRMKNAEVGGFNCQLPGTAKHSREGSTLIPLLLEKIPFFILSAAACVATLVAQHQVIAKWPLSLRVENALVSCCVYLGQMIWPAGLAVVYPYPKQGVAFGEAAGAGALLALISAGAFLWRVQRPWLLAGWLWYLGMLVPVIGVVQVGEQAHADRYTYLPQIGLYLLVAWAAVELGRLWRWRRVVLGTAAGVVLAGLMAAAYVQAGYWRDSLSLWTHTLACTSANYLAHYDLGHALAAQGQAPAAIEEYERALQINPDDADVHISLGSLLSDEGRLAEAIQQFEQAIQLKPDSARGFSDLGGALVRQGQWAQAIPYCERALQLDPAYADAHNNLGLALASQGSLVEAIQHYQRALELQPDYALAHYNLGNALAGQGKLTEAIHQYGQAVQRDPDFAEARHNLGIVLAAQGRTAEAVPQLQQALKLATARGDAALAQSTRDQLKSLPAAKPPAQSP